MKKKITTILVVMCVLVNLIWMGPVFAESKDLAQNTVMNTGYAKSIAGIDVNLLNLAASPYVVDATVAPSNPELEDFVLVTVSVNEGISIVTFSLEYSDEVFDYVDITTADNWNLYFQEEHNFTINEKNYEAATSTEDIAVIRLQVKEDADIGSTTIKLTGIEVSIDDGSAIELDDVPKTVTIVDTSDDGNNDETNNTTNNTTNETDNNTTNNTTNGGENNTNNSTNTISYSGKTDSNTPKSVYTLPFTGKTGAAIIVSILIVAISTIASYIKYKKYRGI